jgi:hypothetical protein
LTPTGAAAMSDQTTVFKAVDEEQRIVWSEVYAPLKIDSDIEYMTAEDIREMAYKFMKEMKLDQIDTQHNNQLVDGCRVVESFIVRKGDPTFIEGAWVVGVHIPCDDTWARVKKGELNGFSMQGLVEKTDMIVEMEIPPFLRGQTMKSEDGHEHTFVVAYDEEGNFVGGETDVVNGHSHRIRKGTATEISVGHSHRFSHVEGMNMVSQTEKA